MRPKRVLIVDDEPQVLKLFATILRRRGYEVLLESSGQFALSGLPALRPDLLILDLSMPEPDGFEILKQVRAMAPQIRVLVISGFLQGSMLRAAEFVGAAATLSKVEAPERLAETVEGLVGPAA